MRNAYVSSDSMTKVPTSRGLRIPVRYLGGHWEFELGGAVPVYDSTTAELIVSKRPP
jgi:hypothetical protein